MMEKFIRRREESLSRVIDMFHRCFGQADCSNSLKVPEPGCSLCMKELEFHSGAVKDLLEGVPSLERVRQEALRVCFLSGWR